MINLRAYLVLMRPPNLLTAVADVLAGFAAAASFHHVVGHGPFEFLQHELPWKSLSLTALASVLLYGGGVVLNDVFDADLDREERPERPIPAGLVQKKHAGIFGVLLLLSAVIISFLSNTKTGIIAVIIVLLVIAYDAFSKKHKLFGPVNMGLCRGANLMLGVSIFPEHLQSLVFLMIIPIIYVAAITLVSRGEVHGSSRSSLTLGLILYILTVIMIASLAVLHNFNLLQCIPLLLLLIIMVFPPLLKARRSNDPNLIGKAVKYAVLGLILMDAAIAAGFAGWFFGLLLLILLPFSIGLAKTFAVT